MNTSKEIDMMIKNGFTISGDQYGRRFFHRGEWIVKINPLSKIVSKITEKNPDGQWAPEFPKPIDSLIEVVLKVVPVSEMDLGSIHKCWLEECGENTKLEPLVELYFQKTQECMAHA